MKKLIRLKKFVKQTFLKINMTEKVIILTRGIQGSGKSYWANNWVKEYPESRIRLNWDCLRNMFGEYWVPNREKSPFLSNLTNTFLYTAMENGWDIVIDNMNLNPKIWSDIQKKIDVYNAAHTEFKYKLEYKDFFNVSVEECIRRDSIREHPIGENVIRQTYKKYSSFIHAKLANDYFGNLNTRDSTKKNCILVDMDSTLCYNLSGRPFYGEGAAEGMLEDIPAKEVINLVEKYTSDDNVDVIVLTGREDTIDIRNATETWLTKHIKGPISKLIMRNEGDYRSDVECKLDLFKREIEPYYNVLFALEDSSEITKLWRDNGIVCLQTTDGTF